MIQQIKKPFVILVGYHPTVPGGVTEITSVLLPHLPEVLFFTSLKYYQPRWKAVLYALCAYVRFARCVYAYHPAVVHVIVASPGDLWRNGYYVLFSRICKSRVIVQFHYDIAPDIFKLSRFTRWCVVFYMRRAHVLCFLSDMLRNGFASSVFSPHCMIIPNPIASVYFENGPLPREQRDRRVVYLGRDDPQKGLRELREVAAGLTGVHDITFHCYTVAGRDSVEKNGMHRHPWVTDEVKREIIRRALLLVLPSYKEAFPVCLLEAAASGTPVVASSVGGIPDLIADKEQGLLIPPMDAHSLAEAIKSLIVDHALWERCSRNQRERSARYELSHIVDEWHCLYARLAAEGAGSAGKLL